jgi:hypothetical protein
MSVIGIAITMIPANNVNTAMNLTRRGGGARSVRREDDAARAR